MVIKSGYDLMVDEDCDGRKKTLYIDCIKYQKEKFRNLKVLISMKEKNRTHTNNSNHTIYRKYSLTKIDDSASEGS